MQIENSFNLASLDDHIIYDIIGFLNPQELLSITQVSKRFHNLSKEDFHYKIQCQNYYFEGPLIVDVKPDGISYKQYFFENIERVKRYKSILNKIINLNVLDENYNYFKNFQTQKPFFNDSKKLQQILQITKQVYQKIPKDVLILYRILNGQAELGETDEPIFQKMGLFGLVEYYNYYQNYIFNSFMKPPCGFLEDIKAHPFSQIDPLNKYLYLDLTNKLGYGHQVIYNFSPFRGQENTMYINIVHSSIDSFMEKLSRANWNSEEQYNDLFDTLNQPGSDTTTKGIRIRATAQHITVDRNNGLDQNFYSYSIRISAHNMPEGVRYKLKSRRWVITKHTNPDQPEIVEGEGVIGKYPEIYAGCPDFIYQSCSMMEGYTGHMSGSFQFYETNTKEFIDAKIDAFPLCPDTDQKLICYNLLTQQSELIYQGNQ